MEMLIKAMLIAALCSVFGLAIKKNSPEISLLLTAAVSCAALAAAMHAASDIVEFLHSLSEISGVSAVSISTVLKTVGIGIISKLACEICRDAGQTAAASAVEILGSAAALYIALPLIRSVLKMITSLV